MTIRQELESKVAEWAATQSPPIPVSYEGVPFTKPASGPYLQLFMLPSVTTNPTVDGVRKRIRGFFQINVCVPDGKGSKQVEEIAEAIASLFPVADKAAFPTVSIEQHAQTGQATIDAGFRVVPVTVRYRQES